MTTDTKQANATQYTIEWLNGTSETIISDDILLVESQFVFADWAGEEMFVVLAANMRSVRSVRVTMNAIEYCDQVDADQSEPLPTRERGTALAEVDDRDVLTAAHVAPAEEYDLTGIADTYVRTVPDTIMATYGANPGDMRYQPGVGMVRNEAP